MAEQLHVSLPSDHKKGWGKSTSTLASRFAKHCAVNQDENIILHHKSIFRDAEMMLFCPQRLQEAIQDAMALANDAVNEAVSGIRVVRSFNNEAHEIRRYDDRLMDIVNLKNRRDTVRTIYLLIYRVRDATFLSWLSQVMVFYNRQCCSFLRPAHRPRHAGAHVVLRQAVYPERTDDDWQPGLLHPLPVGAWRLHQGRCQKSVCSVLLCLDLRNCF